MYHLPRWKGEGEITIQYTSDATACTSCSGNTSYSTDDMTTCEVCPEDPVLLRAPTTKPACASKWYGTIDAAFSEGPEGGGECKVMLITQ